MARSPQLSATTLSLFQECPRCFWLHMRADVKRPARPFPSITGGIDRLVQAYCDAWRPSIPPLICHAPTAPTAMPVWQLADPKIASLRWKPTDIPLVGRLDDCLVRADGVVMPLDHKSRGSQPALGYSALYYQLQMDVYALLLHKNGYPLAQQGYLAYYYPAGGEQSRLERGFPFACVVEALEVSASRAEACYRAACACLDDECPMEPAASCGYCAWITTALTYPLVRSGRPWTGGPLPQHLSSAP